MVILGLCGCIGFDPKDAWLHGSGASLWKDGKHICTISEERLSRIKYDGSYPQKSISYVLGTIELFQGGVDVVVFAEHVHRNLFKTSKGFLKQQFPNAEIKSINHHYAHAAGAYYTSGFNEASVLSFDGSGNSFLDDSYETGFFGEGKKLNPIVRLQHFRNYPNQRKQFNLGQVYNNFSRYCYQRMMPDAKTGNPYMFMETAPGKIMGLSGYGKIENIEKLKEVLLFEVELNDGNFPVVLDENETIDQELFKNYTPEDISLYLQCNFEYALLRYLQLMGIRKENLCIAGGCGLNVLANRLILDNKLFKKVHIFPAANDFGLCYGAAINEVAKSGNIKKHNLAYLGKEYSKENISKEIDDFEFENDVKIAEVDDFEFGILCDKVAKDINKGKVIAWFQDKSEFGPRALGNRSILANPMIKDMKDTLNSKVKYREYWRPYAPVVLEEECRKYFDLPEGVSSPHMMLSAKVLVDTLPAITHEDGTARVQTVRVNENYRLATLLESFQRLTGVPVLLNTSFNGGGEPIVETPLDALKSFDKMNIDVLVLGNHYIKKTHNKEI